MLNKTFWTFLLPLHCAFFFFLHKVFSRILVVIPCHQLPVKSCKINWE